MCKKKETTKNDDIFKNFKLSELSTILFHYKLFYTWKPIGQILKLSSNVIVTKLYLQIKIIVRNYAFKNCMKSLFSLKHTIFKQHPNQNALLDRLRVLIFSHNSISLRSTLWLCCLFVVVV